MSTLRTPHSAPRTPPGPSLHERFQELNAASSREAAALAEQGKRAGLWGLLCAPLLTFLYVYLWSGEWRRGIAGLVVALFAAYEVFVRYAKLWELHHSSPQAPPPKEGARG
jgi:hypothetical protein